jgi:hypothetical protein
MKMTPRERFKVVVRFEEPDYVPIFGFAGAPGMSWGCQKTAHDRLIATGMPADVGGMFDSYGYHNVQSWWRYWGTTGPIDIDFALAWGADGFKTTTRVEGGFEIVESESGALTRQVIDNDVTYSMPEFIRYPVRDRESWTFYRERITPSAFLSREEMEARCRRYDERAMPLEIGASSGYGTIRGLMGPEAASFAFYDDPELVHDILEWHYDQTRQYVFPLIERLHPEIVATGEDLCYNHGMLLSPKHFEEFCAPYYRELSQCCHASGVDMIGVDTDGNITEFAGVAAACGVTALFPCEVKAGNDLFELRKRYPDLTFFGWLEKETINEGNEEQIELEIRVKVPPLLAEGGYFPNGDHGIQPLATFPNLCRFMTILHEVCNNPEGEFPGRNEAARGDR